MLTGFKNFIMRGNLVEIAVAFIVGGAFATVVSTFTAMLLSLISKVTGEGVNFDRWQPGHVPVGAFLTATIAFLIVAAAVYFLVVTPYNKLQDRVSRGEQPAPPAPEIALLTEIRDLLANRPRISDVEGGGGQS